MKLVRTKYLQELETLRNTNLVKILTGARRVGKSTILEQFARTLEKQGIKPKQIMHINLEKREYADYLDDYLLLFDYIVANVEKDKQVYIFIDEVQNVVQFEKLIDALYAEENFDVYITGSNAYMLSSDLATLFAGRYVEIKVYPFSFQEYKEFRSLLDEKVIADNLLFRDYLYYGSLPETATLLRGSEDGANNYLKSVYESILQKDISFRTKFNDKDTLDKVIKYILDSQGSPISSNNISNNLKAIGVEISQPTVNKILQALNESYLFYRANRQDIKGKNILKTNPKYYVFDTGVRNSILNKDFDSDLGHILENVVYFELLRRSRAVHTGKIGPKEIDFVSVDKDGYINYFQVAWSTLEQTTLKRELAPFALTKDRNSSYLLTMDDFVEISHNGVKKVNIIDWLLQVERRGKLLSRL